MLGFIVSSWLLSGRLKVSGRLKANRILDSVLSNHFAQHLHRSESGGVNLDHPLSKTMANRLIGIRSDYCS
uniref:Secreted protein n=1 Tax=Ascaris lumbricoides TaxID=6252 RepID=A0A0M3I0Z3_ASCLU